MDRISSLPDDVLCHILSFLPTKHAVATSILSSRWVNLWSFLTIIDLDDSLYLNPSRKYPNSVRFINFLDRVFSLNQSETIVKFRLSFHEYYGQTLSRINRFIQNVISRNVFEIDLGIYFKFHVGGDVCLNIPNSQSLKILKIRCENGLKMPAFPGCFPRLRVCDLRVSLFESGDELITNLFACLPALEKLHLAGDLTDCDEEINVNIGGSVLKCLELELLNGNCFHCDAMVVIDAPKLEYLRLQDRFIASYMVKNKPAISEVRLDLGAYDEEFIDFLEQMAPTRHARFDELLLGLVNAKFISVSATTLKHFLGLPELPSVTKLEVNVHIRSWMLLLYWLESFPNLKVLSLIIKERPVGEVEEQGVDEPPVVPECLLSRVKEIEITRRGKVDEEEILKYFLDNAMVLDKLTVNSCVYIKNGILQNAMQKCR